MRSTETSITDLIRYLFSKWKAFLVLAIVMCAFAIGLANLHIKTYYTSQSTIDVFSESEKKPVEYLGTFTEIEVVKDALSRIYTTATVDDASKSIVVNRKGDTIIVSYSYLNEKECVSFLNQIVSKGCSIINNTDGYKVGINERAKIINKTVVYPSKIKYGFLGLLGGFTSVAFVLCIKYAIIKGKSA